MIVQVQHLGAEDLCAVVFHLISLQGRSQNLKLGGAVLLLVVCSDFDFRLRCYLVA